MRAMVDIRMNPKLRRKVDPSDVLQEAFLEASKRLERYLKAPEIPFFLWIRHIAVCTLYNIHRHYLKTKARNPRREVAIPELELGASSEALLSLFLGKESSFEQAARRQEIRTAIKEVIDGLDPVDREILTLRFFEELSAAETAQVLGLGKAEVRKGYLRALERCRRALRRQLPSNHGLG